MRFAVVMRPYASCLLPAAMLFVLACGGDDGDGQADALVSATDALFPDNATGTQAEGLAAEILAAGAAGDLPTAEARAFDLTELTLAEFRAGRLVGATATLPGRLKTYLEDVLDEGGLPAPSLAATSFGDEGIVAVVRAAGGTFVAPSLRAGLQVPADALNRAVLLVATRLADASQYAPGAGPLPTALDQYPLFYEFTLTPEVEFSADAIVGLCQVTEPASAYYAPDPVFARLQLAHPDPADRSRIALLERVEAPFLDCDGVTASASRASLLARRPGIGGRVRKFSPFGAVDPSAGTLPEGMIDPIPYTSLGNSPFNGAALPAYFHLEDWEDGSVNTPGVTPSSTTTGSSFGPGLIDSVDDDDGSVNGICAKAEGTCDSGFAGGTISFEFDAAVLGSLPTHVGVVWTDGSAGCDAIFEAYDANDVLIGTRTAAGVGDGTNSGSVAEDRFFGVIAAGGIKRIVVKSSAGGVEVDHLQYGR